MPRPVLKRSVKEKNSTMAMLHACLCILATWFWQENCVLTPSDCTGSLNVSRALARLVTGLDLVDVWDMNQGRMIYTHYTAQEASQIDRI